MRSGESRRRKSGGCLYLHLGHKDLPSGGKRNLTAKGGLMAELKGKKTKWTSVDREHQNDEEPETLLEKYPETG